MPSLSTRLLLLPLLLALLSPMPAAAQGPANTLRPGDDVRVHAPSFRSGRVRGTVVLYQGETLEVRESGTGQLVAIPVASIRGLARNEGLNRGRSSWRMARLGGFIGGAGGLVSGPLIATSRAPKNFGRIMIASGIVGGLVGTGTGAILGAIFAGDQWQSFRTPISPTLGGVPGDLRVGLTMSLP